VNVTGAGLSLECLAAAWQTMSVFALSGDLGQSAAWQSVNVGLVCALLSHAARVH
jgi:hypothetical protein